MDLINQFQGLFGSLFLGFFFMWFFHLFNKVFTSKLIIIGILLNLILFLGYTVVYLIFLFNRTRGVYNIFFLPALFIGSFLYERFYASYFEEIFIMMQKKLKEMINSFKKLMMKKKSKKIKR